ERVAGSTAMPAVCRQCEEAPCVAACPNEAMYVDEAGIVRRGKVLCTGCGSCALACPFGVIDAETTRSEIAKCDLCAERTPQGLLPRCVSICPSGALKFLEIAEEVPAAGYTLLSGRTLHRSR
ncbi:MAG: 4Fe-4S dicluster domain-containing protein, partial [Planctomycetota bacterium]